MAAITARLSIGQRIWLAIALPVTVALVAATSIAIDKIDAIDKAERTGSVVAMAIRVSSMVHEMQKERGMSSAFLASRGERMKSERAAQIPQTDLRRRDLETAMDGMGHGFGSALEGAMAQARLAMAPLPDLRQAVDRQELTAPQAVGKYTSVVVSLLAVAETLATLDTDIAINNSISAYLALMLAKENAGVERATAAAALAQGSMSEQALQKLKALAAVQDTHFRAFAVRATPDQQRRLDAALNSADATLVTTMRKQMFDSPTPDLTVEQWFGTASKRIDLMKQTEDSIAADLDSAINANKAEARQTLIVVGSILGLTLLGVATIAMILARSITRPAKRLTNVMLRLADNDLGVAVTDTDRADEIGDMGRAVLVFKRHAEQVSEMEAEREAAQAKAEEDRRSALTHMATAIEGETGTVVQRVGSESERVCSAATTMAESAVRVEDNSQRVAAAAEQSLANAQTVAGAAEELTASIRSIADQVGLSSTQVSDAVQAAENATNTVSDLVLSMSRIDQVVSMISAIANQTRLLALNATIESARAGDAGKGFAVVAAEVKRLADQTGSQTAEITARIEELKVMADNVSAAIGTTVSRIRSVEEISKSIADSVMEQDAATKEIAVNVVQSADAAREVTERITIVADEARRTGHEASQVNTLLEKMANQVSQLGHILTHVVRTAAPEVDRRTEQRQAVGVPATLVVNGQTIQATLADVSSGGALLDNVDEQQDIQSGTINAHTLGTPKTFRVIARENRQLRVRFESAA